MVDEIIEASQPAADKLKETDKKIRLIGQYDADGISATAIAFEMLKRLDKDFEYEILKQLYEEDVKRFAEAEEDLLLFVDIGSGQSKNIQEHILENTDKDVIISDHHEPQIKGDGIHLNPHFLGYDGGEQISAAGMTYLLAKTIDKENQDLVTYALIGATGDIQKQDGEFLGLNKEIAEEAIENDYIERRKGLDLYGRTTKPLQKSLMYTSDPHLEGVTNNESGAIQLIKSSGVTLRENGDFKTLADLTPEEEKKLINTMIRNGYPVQELLNDIYTLPNGYEIDEYSTIINACGRLGEPKKGVKILRENDEKLIKRISRKYGRKISKSLRYVEKNKDDTEIIYENGIGVIDGQDKIKDDFIGTVTTISMSNGFFETAPVIVGVAETEKGDQIKASCRAKKQIVEDGLVLGEIVEGICEEIDGEGGGHNIAAGAKIPLDKKEEFLDKLTQQVQQEV